MVWNGESFELRIETNIAAWPAEWLNEHRSYIIPDPDDEGLHMHVVPAEWYEPGDAKGGIRRWGEVVVSGLTEPFPDVAALQETLESALGEAVASAEEAHATARKYLGQLHALRPNSGSP